jgi:hypothetical protein
VHLFIENGTTTWTEFPYAVQALWTNHGPARRSLYLHCLVPQTHEQRATALAHEWLSSHGGTTLTMIRTDDGWQDLAPLTETLREDGEPTPREETEQLSPPSGVPPTDLAKDLPLIIPVAIEVLRHHRALREIWQSMRARLGQRIWRFLPRHSPRWEHNGHRYVRQALQRLSQFGLVRQHMIHYAPFHARMVEVFLLIDGAPSGLLARVRRHAPILESYKTPDGYLIRAFGALPLLKVALGHGAVRGWWFVDPYTPLPRTRFAYEDLFDEEHRSWVT